MADWQTISDEIRRGSHPVTAPNGDFDTVRKAKLRALETVTGRPAVLYATDFTNQLKANVAPQVGASVSIDLSDKNGFYQVTKDIAEADLDVVLHSPGGSAEAVDSIVALLRSRFTDIRFIIPSVAKSAATMLAMSGNRIIMDEISELGPIDPQLIINRGGQTIVAPLQSIRDQFLRAQGDLAKNPERLPSWMPILQQYGPSLLVECDNRIELARSLVERWLRDYMFAADSDAQQKAASISTFLADDKNFLSHARRVGIDELRANGVEVDDMRNTPPLREAVHELYIAAMLTFQGTGAVKIFENSRDQGLLTVMQSQIVQPQPAPPTTGAPAASPTPVPRGSPGIPLQGPGPASQGKRKRR